MQNVPSITYLFLLRVEIRIFEIESKFRGGVLYAEYKNNSLNFLFEKLLSTFNFSIASRVNTELIKINYQTHLRNLFSKNFYFI